MSKHGKRIRTLAQLMDASLNRKAVISVGFVGLAKPRAAAFVICWPGQVLHRLLLSGLFIYRKPNNQTRK